MGRGLVAQLDDIFAEIGFNRCDAGFGQGGIERDLLRDHRLAFGHNFCAGFVADVENDLPRLLCGARPMHMPAGLDDFLLVAFEVKIEMGKGVVFDVAGTVAQGFEFGQFGCNRGPLVDKTGADIQHGFLQLRIAEGFMRIVFEAVGGGMGGHGRDLPAGSEKGFKDGLRQRRALLSAARRSCPPRLPQHGGRQRACRRG